MKFNCDFTNWNFNLDLKKDFRFNKIEIDIYTKKKIFNKLYDSYYRPQIISKFLNVSRYLVAKWIKELGYDNSEYWVLKDHNIDPTFFEKIDTEGKAYILGLLYSDGWVRDHEFGIELRDYDKDILINIKNILNTNYEIKSIIQKYNNKTKYQLRIYSKKISRDLIKLGCVKNKSLILKFPNFSIVPENLIKHFIRGYFDGDGSVSHHSKNILNNIKINFSGCVSFIYPLKKYLNEINILPDNKINFGKDKERKIFCTMEWNGKNNLISLYNYLYKDANYFGSRKKAKFDEIICAINEKLLIESRLIAGKPETVISSQATM